MVLFKNSLLIYDFLTQPSIVERMYDGELANGSIYDIDLFFLQSC